MEPASYAVVAYINGPLAAFVESLRSRLTPEQAHVRPHLTLLAPRVLETPRDKLLAALKRICYKAEPVRISLGRVEAFVPSTSTVYLQVQQGASQISSLHQRLNQYGFRAEEPWAYVPHITLAKLADNAAALKAVEEAQEQWAHYSGARDFLVKELTLVREFAPDKWDDLARVPLAANLTQHEGTCPETGRR
ncbi:MAG TPA: 2'-5' RNA ligase family protein [Terriglobales bacterium]|nr:2'-5' RNA ligase family protein [Terriglobales bacterium]